MKTHYRNEAEFMADYNRTMASRQRSPASENVDIERKVLMTRDEAYAAARQQLLARHSRRGKR